MNVSRIGYHHHGRIKFNFNKVLTVRATDVVRWFLFLQAVKIVITNIMFIKRSIRHMMQFIVHKLIIVLWQLPYLYAYPI